MAAPQTKPVWGTLFGVRAASTYVIIITEVDAKMNKVSSDKLFVFILVGVFAVGIGLLTALRFAEVGDSHAKAAEAKPTTEVAQAH